MLKNWIFVFFKTNSTKKLVLSGIFILGLSLFALFSFKSTLTKPSKPKPVLGRFSNPLILGVVPSTSATQSVSTAQTKVLRQCLEKATSLYFQIRVATHHTALVEAMNHGHVHGALLSSYAFYGAHRHGARAILRLVRDGTSSYYGQIVVKANGPIQTLADLQGKTLATVDTTSTSSLYGLKLLKEKNITLGKIWVANTHMAALMGVYQTPPKAQGAAVYFHPGGKDARLLLKPQYPNVFNELKTLVTVGPIPNEPFVVSSLFPSEHTAHFQRTLKMCSQQNIGIFQALSNAQGFEDANDSDYGPFFDSLEGVSPQKNPEKR